MSNNLRQKIIFLIVILSFLSTDTIFSQVIIKTGSSPLNLVKTVLLGDSTGIKVTNVKFTGSPYSIGTFASATKFLPITKGIAISTGMVENMDGPNESTNFSKANSYPGDYELDRIAGKLTMDASILEFTFYPITDEICFEYFFASEEYPEYINKGVNDVFAFFISGNGYEKPQNIALVPITGDPVSVDNINHYKNRNYYLENKKWDIAKLQNSKQEAELAFSFEFDGMTQLLIAKAKVTPYQPYNLKIAIADVGDDIYDSGVFLRANSFKNSGNNIPFITMIEPDLQKELLKSELIKYRIEENKVIIQSNIQFAFNSTALNAEYEKSLNELVQILNQYFNIKLQLTGHTDDVGSDAFNLELSEARAQTIKNYLVSQKIDESRINIIGKGNLMPLSNEKTTKARALNRRVEFILY